MENSKESSIAVGAFDVPTVNPSFMVGNSVEANLLRIGQLLK